MNSGTRSAPRRLGLALIVGGIAAGGAFAASDAPGSATGADDTAAMPGSPPAGDNEAGPARGTGRDHEGFGRGHGGPGFGPGGADRWNHGAAGWHHRGGRGRGMMMSRGFFGALRQLQLTPVQREQMRTIVFNAREAVRMERANERQSGAVQRRRDDFAVLANPGDPNYARAVQQLKSRAAERIQQAITRATETEQKLYDVLTAEQKAQLPKVLSDQRARLEQRMQQMHRRHEGAAPERAPDASPSPPTQ
jgi:Spy/CpxP family protein refolding chaperone